MSNTKITILPNQDLLSQSRDNILITFAGPRTVLGTSSLNGGLHTDLEGVFNHCDKDFHTGYCEMHGSTYEEHLTWVAEQLQLNPTRTSGLSTAADLSYAAIRQEHFQDYTVTAICSGGIARNGRRAGDTATMWEQDGIYHVEQLDKITSRKSGTLNIFLHVNADLTFGAMATALMVVTEAKAATLLERQLKSCYSDRLASGSGTDGIIIIADPTSPIHLRQANTDVKLGQCIARAVTDAVNDQVTTQLRMIAEEEAEAKAEKETTETASPEVAIRTNL